MKKKLPSEVRVRGEGMKKIYFYECLHCGNIEEREQAFASPAFTDLFCYHCGRCRRVQRMICQTTFILKGRGWARDSYGLKEVQNESTTT